MGKRLEPDAAAVVEQALTAPAPVVVLPDVTRAVEGLKFRRVWKWRFVNDDERRAMQLIPRDYLCIDTARLNKYATAMRASAKIAQSW